MPKSKMKGGPKMSLLNAIQSGEGKNVEFKEELPVSQAIAKTVIAFSCLLYTSKLCRGRCI